MTEYKIFKELSLPQSPQLNSIYLIGNTNSEFLKIYVTGNTTGVIKRVMDVDDIKSIMNANSQSIYIVNSINQRDSLDLASNAIVYVKTSTNPKTYLFEFATKLWIELNTQSREVLNIYNSAGTKIY